MPDETGTQTTHSDAPSVDESLFGDAAENTAVAAADEQDAKEETAGAPEGSEDAGEQAGPPEDLKVVVSIKEGRAIIGVQRPSSDPYIESFDDPDPGRGDAGGPCGHRKSESQVGTRTQASGPHETRSPGRGVGIGEKRSRHRLGAAREGQTSSSPSRPGCSRHRVQRRGTGRRGTLTAVYRGRSP